jgi:class 3 adenylate cyclase
VTDARGVDAWLVAAPHDDPGGLLEGLATRLAGAGVLVRRVPSRSFAARGKPSLLDVYLGKNAARRVLADEVQRGRGEQIDAAIWFCDMRGFTASGERRTPEELVAILDAYFDVGGSAIAEFGGRRDDREVQPIARSDVPVEHRATMECDADGDRLLAPRGEHGIQVGVALQRTRGAACTQCGPC